MRKKVGSWIAIAVGVLTILAYLYSLAADYYEFKGRIQVRMDGMSDTLEINKNLATHISETQEEYRNWTGAQLYEICEFLDGSWDQRNQECTLIQTEENSSQF